MNFFFVTKEHSDLADNKSLILYAVRQELLKYEFNRVVDDPSKADIILIEEAFSYKDFRHISKLLADPIIFNYFTKVFTINNDDSAVGFLKGLYTNIAKSRIDKDIHVSVPYIKFYNELVFSEKYQNNNPEYIASWRGNDKSNSIRSTLINVLKGQKGCILESTDSWLNHKHDEKEKYINIIISSKFSLCPSGWGPASFRIYESMALGRCPVIIADEFVPPNGPDWAEFALFFPEKNIINLYEFLKKNESDYDRLGAKAKEIWYAHYGSEMIVEHYVEGLMTLIGKNSSGNYSIEIATNRWRSIKFYWINKWTIPQRIANKIKRIMN